MNNSQTNDSNPYCSGQWSRTNSECSIGNHLDVLILVVVDNGIVLLHYGKFSFQRDLES